MSWKVEQHSGGSWYVVWKGPKVVPSVIHDDQSYLTEQRAVAICEALNRTERTEMRELRRIWAAERRRMEQRIEDRESVGLCD